MSISNVPAHLTLDLRGSFPVRDVSGPFRTSRLLESLGACHIGGAEMLGVLTTARLRTSKPQMAQCISRQISRLARCVSLKSLGVRLLTSNSFWTAKFRNRQNGTNPEDYIKFRSCQKGANSEGYLKFRSRHKGTNSKEYASDKYVHNGHGDRLHSRVLPGADGTHAQPVATVF